MILENNKGNVRNAANIWGALAGNGPVVAETNEKESLSGGVDCAGSDAAFGHDIHDCDCHVRPAERPGCHGGLFRLASGGIVGIGYHCIGVDGFFGGVVF